MADLIQENTIDRELLKHSATVHISNTLTLNARRISNVLLKNAYSLLDKNDKFRIKLSDLRDTIGLEKSENYQIIKDSLDILANTTIKWNIFNKDRARDWKQKKFTMSKILASVDYDEEKGVCEYSYSAHLKDLLKNPNIYAKIDLIIQREFKSKHSLALWEFLVEYICSKNKGDMSYTGWILIEDYRKFLGLQKTEYTDYRNFNRFLIKAPLAEINRVSDIEASVDYKKENRKVVAIKFLIKKKQGFQQKLPFENLPTTEEYNSQDNEFDKIKNSLLTDYKISESKVDIILSKHKLDKISKNLEYVNAELESGRIKNIAAFTINAIKDNYLIIKSNKEIKESEESLLYKELSEINKQIENYNQDLDKFFLQEATNYFDSLEEATKQHLVGEKIKENSNLPLNLKQTVSQTQVIFDVKTQILEDDDLKKEALNNFDKVKYLNIEKLEQKKLALEGQLNIIKANTKKVA